MSKQPLPEVKATPPPPSSTGVPNSVTEVPPGGSTPILSSLLSSTSKPQPEERPPIVPQFDGLNIQTDTETDDSSQENEKSEKIKKNKKINVEKVFEEIENVFIKRGRARPDHNDQAHHWRSKWAKGVYPSDLYIAIGGCSINNIGTD